MILPDPIIKKRNTELDKLIDEIVKGKVARMTNETIEELEKVALRLRNARLMFRTELAECPNLDIIIKKQIAEIERINTWIKKEVD